MANGQKHTKCEPPEVSRKGVAKQYLTTNQLRTRYGGLSHMFIERKLKNDPLFPRPFKLMGSRLNLYDLDAIEKYERACVAGNQRKFA